MYFVMKYVGVITSFDNYEELNQNEDMGNPNTGSQPEFDFSQDTVGALDFGPL